MDLKTLRLHLKVKIFKSWRLRGGYLAWWLRCLLARIWIHGFYPCFRLLIPATTDLQEAAVIGSEHGVPATQMWIECLASGFSQAPAVMSTWRVHWHLCLSLTLYVSKLRTSQKCSDTREHICPLWSSYTLAWSLSQVSAMAQGAEVWKGRNHLWSQSCLPCSGQAWLGPWASPWACKRAVLTEGERKWGLRHFEFRVRFKDHQIWDRMNFRGHRAWGNIVVELGE